MAEYTYHRGSQNSREEILLNLQGMIKSHNYRAGN